MSHLKETVEVHTTYVGDGLGSVLQAALDLQVGSSSAIAFLPAEPGGTCLFFAAAANDVYLQVVYFKDMTSESTGWSGGGLRWHETLSVQRFIRGVVVMAEEVLADCGGADAYSAAWGGIAFPGEKLHHLRKGLLLARLVVTFTRLRRVTG